MNTSEMKVNEMEQVNGGDYYHIVMGLMKLLLPDPCNPPIPKKRVEPEDPIAPVILPQNPHFPRDRRPLRYD